MTKKTVCFRVKDAITGEPIQGANVGGSSIDATVGEWFTTTTDSNGEVCKQVTCGSNWRFTVDKMPYLLWETEYFIDCDFSGVYWFNVFLRLEEDDPVPPVPSPEEDGRLTVPRPTDFLPNWTWKDYALVLLSFGGYLLFKDEFKRGSR